MLYNRSMKKKFLSLMFVATLTTSAIAVPAFALSDASSGSNVSSPTTTSTTTSDGSDSSDTSTSGRATRLEAYKKELKDTLTDAVKLRIENRCVAAQALVKGKTTANTAITKTRVAAYSAIVTELQSLATAASAKGADVTTLQSEITTLQTKITAFNTANATYQQALTDLGALDCKTDPVGFKAALEAARSDQTAVFTVAKDIRTYINDTIKPTLKTLKTSLEAKQ
jgi:hypothetical protein